MDNERKKKLYSIIRERLGEYRKYILILIICFVVVGIIAFAVPLLVSALMDKAFIPKDIRLIVVIPLIMLALQLICTRAELSQNKTLLLIQNRIQKTLYEESFNKICRIKQEYFVDKTSASIINQLSVDIEKASSMADRGMLIFVDSSIKLIGGAAGLVFISWRLAFIVLCMIPVKWFVIAYLSKKKENAVKEYLDTSITFQRWFVDKVEGIKEVKLWNIQSILKDKFMRLHTQLIKTSNESEKIEFYNSVSENVIHSTFTSLVYIVAGIMLANSKLSLGNIMAFLTYSGYVTGAISILLNFKMYIHAIIPSVYRLYDFYELDEEENQCRVELDSEINIIELKNINLSFNERNVLSGINLQMKRGEKIAIIGENGSGKSSIVNLLLRFLEPNSGEILLNGINIQSIDILHYRQCFSVIGQRPHIFEDTIENNITMWNTKEKRNVHDACMKSRFQVFIESIPDGVSTRINNNGENMSGGERQKLIFARELLKDTPIVILDEGTSNIDMEADQKIQELLERECKDKLLIIISHNQSHLKNMDHIYVLSNGELECVK